MPQPYKVFTIYAREDAQYLEELRGQLRPLEIAGRIKVWSDREINPGVDWEREIVQNLDNADIILILVSAAYYSSVYIHEKEIKYALTRHENGQAKVLPIIVRPCSFSDDPVISRLQVLPTDGKPVTDRQYWPERDGAWLDVVTGIKRTIDILRNAENGAVENDLTPPSSHDETNQQFPGSANRNKPPKSGWKPFALWALGLVIAVVGLFMGYNYLFKPVEQEKAYLASETPTVQIGKISVGESRYFNFVVSNLGKTKVLVNVVRCDCHYIRIIDTATITIPANTRRTYRAEWVGQEPAGITNCTITVGDSSFVKQALIVVQAEVVSAGEPQGTTPIEFPKTEDSHSWTTTKTEEKAQLMIEGAPLIDLGELKQGSEKTFSFKLRNESLVNAYVNQVVNSCSAVLTATKNDGSNVIHPNTSGSYKGIWKANKPGQQQCTLIINGSNLKQQLSIVVKANVKAVGGDSGGDIHFPTKSVRCLTHGVGGIKVWFYDAESNKYEKTSVSGQDDLQFDIPQSLSGKIIEVNYKRGTKEDHRDEMLSPSAPFEVPLGIRN